MDIRMMTKILWETPKIQARERWTRRQLDAHQANALRSLRDYAYAHSPFYREFHKGRFEAPLQELPVLTKAMMMDHFDDLVTDRAIHLRKVQAYMSDMRAGERFLGRYLINATSGTSGLPGVSIFNSVEWTTMTAATFAHYKAWMGVKVSLVNRLKTATITSTAPFHMSTQGDVTLRRLRTSLMHLAVSEPLTSIVERLNAWQPESLIVFAQMGRLLADEQLAGRLRITPRTVSTVAEVLTEETRRRMVQAWGERIFNNYAASECGGIASECDRHLGMHLWEDLLIVENVDRDNRPVPPGVFGDKLLVTALIKRTQPLIRYELDDSVRMATEACPCGRPFGMIDAVQGRVSEILTFPGVAGESVKVHPVVIHQIMDTLPVSGWQVLQEADGLHVLLCGINGTVDEEQLRSLFQQPIALQGAVTPRIDVRQVPFIPQTVAGKTPLVKSNLPGVLP